MRLFCKVFHWPWHRSFMLNDATMRVTCNLCGDFGLSPAHGMSWYCWVFHRKHHFRNDTKIKCTKCGQRHETIQ